MAKQLKCPYCKSIDVTPLGKQGFSKGKAIVGTLALGPVGLLAGANRKKYDCVCNNCHKTFTFKA